jgi:hypothetical protein
MNLGRIERQYAHFPVTATLHDGTDADLSDVSVALVPRSAAPTAATAWTPVTVTDGRVRVLLAGPDAEAADGALTVPDDGAELWVRVLDSPEVDTVKVERVQVS